MIKPILATRSLSKISAARIMGERVPMTVKVTGGLNYLRGNSSPYFTITMDAHRKGFPNQSERGGADHDTIARIWRGKFDDLIALHLSDIDGVPIYAVANGWYWLAGARGGAGEQHHGGNGMPSRTPDECLAVFAKHFRISLDEAARLRDDPAITGKADLAAYADTQRPRWKAEADACVARHGLVLFGDPLPVRTQAEG